MSEALFETSPLVETMRATLARKVYNESGRIIYRVTMDPGSCKDADGKRRNVSTVLGSMAEPLIGQLYEFSGKVEFDDNYKQWQMRFDSFRTILPTDRDGIASYLIDVARWVGPTIAKALLDAFGTETLTVLKNEPERVNALGVAGLTPDRVTEMQRSLVDNEELEAATVELNNLLAGTLGPATTKKAIKKWGCNAATLIKGCAYLLMKLHGVGFVSADAIHKKLGGDPQDLMRHSAALHHILHEAATRDGHTIVPRMLVEQEGQKLVGGLRPEVFVAGEDVELDGEYVALSSLSQAEVYVASKIKAMLSAETKANPAHYPEIDNAGLASDQIGAVAKLQYAPVGILTGAPGTGKTYTTARIVDALRNAGLVVFLAAPTGKAAKQMNVALGGGDAMTIHSLLMPLVDEETGEFRFSRDETMPLECDVLVVDEFSMVDILLCRSLLRAVKETTRVLIVGDHYQLPSVGPGAVLRDLIASGVPSFELKEIKRNAGTIVKACHTIKDGREPTANDRLDLEKADPDNWRHVTCGGADEIKLVVASLLTEKLKEANVDPVWGAQIISPTNERGELSCDAMNELAKGLLNPRPNEKGLKFAVGDKVVRTKNGYANGHFVTEPHSGIRDSSGTRHGEGLRDDLAGNGGRLGTVGLDASSDSGRRLSHPQSSVLPAHDPLSTEIRIVNGDLGIVGDIDAKHVTVHLRYPERIVRIPRAEHHLKLAYCLTCHKMQGSEVEVVILPLSRDIAKLPLCTREWIYTAISRAKRFLVTVGDLGAIGPMVRRVGNTKRITMLVAALAPSPRNVMPGSEWADL